MLATIQGWIFSWPMVFQNGKARLRFAFLSLDRSTTRRNVDRTYREKVERKEGEEILLLPSYSLAAYVALSKCLPLGG